MRTKISITLVAALALTTVAAPASAAPDDEAWPHCRETSVIKQDLPNGTRWQMCWRTDAKTGLVLDKVAVKGPRDPKLAMVLDSITLAQLNVPYDTGETEFNDLTSFGMGAEALQPLAPADCKGTRRGEWTGTGESSQKVLCISVQEHGLAYRSADGGDGDLPRSKQGNDLVLSVISKVGWYEYMAEYRLSDNGKITARLGATGDLSPGDFSDKHHGWPVGQGNSQFSANHYHTAFWRVHPNIGGTGKNAVEQFDTVREGAGPTSAKFKTTRKTIAREANLSTALRRKWRMVSPTSKNTDGHPRSYELVFGTNDLYEAHKELVPDVSVTEYKACEKFATFNLDPQCRGKSVLEFANREKITNPLIWVRVGFHHIPRDEDQSPMPTHWQGFDLVPRDFSADNQLAAPPAPAS